MRIGITVFVHSKPKTIWDNGATQNCFSLYRLLQSLAIVDEVYMIHCGDGAEFPPSMLAKDIPLSQWEDVKDKIDVLIEMGAQISADKAEYIHSKGGKTIGYRFGNSCIIDTERMIHGKDPGAIINGTVFDEIWSNAQHMNTNATYWGTIYRCPVRCVPHIWDPYFIEVAKSEMADYSFDYEPGDWPKRIAIFEPNINIVKTCIIPILVCEAVYREAPAMIDHVYVTNALKLKEHETFSKMMKSLDIVKDGKISFEDRYKTPFFLAKYTDLVLSHDWENELNYLYYEALYGGYPLVHTSTMLNGCGYRYHNYDVDSGAMALKAALTWHDKQGKEIPDNQKELFQGCMIGSPTVQKEYTDHLQDLWD